MYRHFAVERKIENFESLYVTRMRSAGGNLSEIDNRANKIVEKGWTYTIL